MADAFTQAGEELTADIIGAQTPTPTWRIGWGTGAGVASKASTTLFSESAEARQDAALSQPTADSNEFRATLISLSQQIVTNAGVFSALSGGTLYIHSDFPGIALDPGDGILFIFTQTWE